MTRWLRCFGAYGKSNITDHVTIYLSNFCCGGLFPRWAETTRSEIDDQVTRPPPTGTPSAGNPFSSNLWIGNPLLCNPLSGAGHLWPWNLEKNVEKNGSRFIEQPHATLCDLGGCHVLTFCHVYRDMRDLQNPPARSLKSGYLDILEASEKSGILVATENTPTAGDCPSTWQDDFIQLWFFSIYPDGFPQGNDLHFWQCTS